jgi:hypothetical protein
MMLERPAQDEDTTKKLRVVRYAKEETEINATRMEDGYEESGRSGRPQDRPLGGPTQRPGKKRNRSS